MSYMTWKERLTVPTYDNPAYARSGRVSVDEERCNGCGNCVMICPGKALYLVGEGSEKKARMTGGEFPECVSCNDCAAMCKRGAIAASTSYDFGYYYKVLHRGEFCPPRRF